MNQSSVTSNHIFDMDEYVTFDENGNAYIEGGDSRFIETTIEQTDEWYEPAMSWVHQTDNSIMIFLILALFILWLFTLQKVFDYKKRYELSEKWFYKFNNVLSDKYSQIVVIYKEQIEYLEGVIDAKTRGNNSVWEKLISVLENENNEHRTSGTDNKTDNS